MEPCSGARAVRQMVQQVSDPQVIPLLVAAMAGADAKVARVARAALESLPEGESQDALCEMAIAEPEGAAAKLCIDRQLRHRKHDRHCLMLVVTGQIDAYLKKDDDPQVIPLLVAAMAGADAKVARVARAALESLPEGESQDALCEMAIAEPEGAAAKLCIDRQLRHRKHDRHCLMLVVTGQIDAYLKKDDDPQVIPLLVAAMAGADAKVARVARAALESLPEGESQDALCEMAIAEPEGAAAKLCIDRQLRHRKHDRHCLMLVVTGQIDAYLKKDDDFCSLRAQYEQADAKVRARVMEVLRQGDLRCHRFITRPRTKLRDCTEAEIKLALASCLRSGDWTGLFNLSIELPLRFSIPTFQRLADSGWHPESPETESLVKAVWEDLKWLNAVRAERQPIAGSSVLAKWLAQGSESKLASLDRAELLMRFDQGSPPEGVAIVGALAAKAKPDAEVAKAVSENQHWMVRLAGHVCGLVTPDPMHSQENSDPSYLNMLPMAQGLLELWPTEATAVDVEKLSQYVDSSSGNLSKMSFARKVLANPFDVPHDGESGACSRVSERFRHHTCCEKEPKNDDQTSDSRLAGGTACGWASGPHVGGLVERGITASASAILASQPRRGCTCAVLDRKQHRRKSSPAGSRRKVSSPVAEISLARRRSMSTCWGVLPCRPSGD